MAGATLILPLKRWRIYFTSFLTSLTLSNHYLQCMQDYQNKGWVRLYRKIEDNDLWLAEPFTRGQAWVDILLLANHKPRSIFIRGNEVKIERGQFIHSEETLSDRWKWSRGKTRAFLALLVTRGMLDNRKSRLCAIRTVVNYVDYQQNEQQTGQQNVQQKAIRLDNRQDTNKNGKNVRMEEVNTAPPDGDAELHKNIVAVFEKFQMTELNTTIKYGDRTQRKAAKEMIGQFGMDAINKIIDFLASEQVLKDPYAPRITTPYQLQQKWGLIRQYYAKLIGKQAKNTVTIIE